MCRHMIDVGSDTIIAFGHVAVKIPEKRFYIDFPKQTLAQEKKIQ